ncbi:uncharacterized protein DNG_07687 [Cephalotrichum gorgonifer]|uniref:Uncharacterized protein n=1 Tax=Cephalotrichum gorgonifer TaxID=2041049 RepID=A0AAE8N2V8_9PEZI|nr:uncharacterized protein DNG_07687 [Cephalotrichum gorgonifer]
MSRFFPHATYAEDQPLAHTILWTHVLTRAVTTGSVVGLGIFSAREASRRLSPTKAALPALFPRLIRTAGTSTIATVGVVTLGTVARMWGRQDIEWQDRSWRLMANSGQLSVDDWTYPSMIAAVLAAGASGRLVGAGPRGVIGVAGLGSVAGTVGYLGSLALGKPTHS